MNWEVSELAGADAKQATCEELILQLPEWFGMEGANERYIGEVADKDAFIVRGPDKNPLGMLSLRRPFPNNADILWLGVLSTHHRQGIGQALLAAAKARALAWGCGTLTVETLGPSHPDEGYKRTREFYTSVGFKPLFEVTYTGSSNPTLYLLMTLGNNSPDGL